MPCAANVVPSTTRIINNAHAMSRPSPSKRPDGVTSVIRLPKVSNTLCLDNSRYVGIRQAGRLLCVSACYNGERPSGTSASSPGDDMAQQDSERAARAHAANMSHLACSQFQPAIEFI